MTRINNQTTQDVDQGTRPAVQSLRLDKSVHTDVNVAPSRAIPGTFDVMAPLVAGSKILEVPTTSGSIAYDGEASNGSSINDTSIETSETANVVTNNPNSSSGDDGSNAKPDSLSNALTGTTHEEPTKIGNSIEELIEQSPHVHKTGLGLLSSRSPHHGLQPTQLLPQHDAHQGYRSGEPDSCPMKTMNVTSSTQVPVISKPSPAETFGNNDPVVIFKKRTGLRKANPASSEYPRQNSGLQQDSFDSKSADSGYDASGSDDDLSGLSSPSAFPTSTSCPLSCHKAAHAHWPKSDNDSLKEEMSSLSDLPDFSSGNSSVSSSRADASISKVVFNNGATFANNLAASQVASAKPESTSVVSYSPRHTRRESSSARIPSKWSFVERQRKRKINFEDLIKKKSYEDHCKELNANFRSAVKRIRGLDSGTSFPSVKSSLSTTGYTIDARSTFPGLPVASPYINSGTPIYDVGVDVMANILTYLLPTEVYSVLSMPLSKTFKTTFADPQDLWKVLCVSAPFFAKIDKNADDSDDSNRSYPICKSKSVEAKHLVGRYRLLYSSFIQCARYLDRIKDDAKNGRTPAAAYKKEDKSESLYDNDNDSLTSFFASAHRMKRSSDDDGSKDHPTKRQKSELDTKKPKVKYGVSKLTNNLLGPQHSVGIAGHVGLPWSCAMYSVTNWMVAFTDVAGIQLMCLKVLPDLLVDEQQRTSAQHVGLTDVVLRAMVLFPDMVELHTAAFHTLVLLARPLGGKEGMLFHSAMVKSDGIFNIGSSTGKSGIAIMLDSMKRFYDNVDLQAMSCWSMVNIALIPSQKIVLVRLGGISAATNAMIHHPHNAEVQFRALFALINLVIPSDNLANNSIEAREINSQVAGMHQNSEIEMLEESIEHITNLVVVAMKNFCSSEAILNRACLVLHNLSLNAIYHKVLLLTPNCYQMLEWCIGNYRHDNVLQQSACGTLSRLQQTISSDRAVRHEFTESIRVQQQHAVKSARNDMVVKPSVSNV